MRWDCTVISSSLPKQDSNASTIPSDSVTLRWAHFSVPQFSYLQEADSNMAHLLDGCEDAGSGNVQQSAEGLTCRKYNGSRSLPFFYVAAT